MILDAVPPGHEPTSTMPRASSGGRPMDSDSSQAINGIRMNCRATPSRDGFRTPEHVAEIIREQGHPHAQHDQAEQRDDVSPEREQRFGIKEGKNADGDGAQRKQRCRAHNVKVKKWYSYRQ